MEAISFYRCTVCHGVVSKWDIVKSGSCPKCGGTRIQPSNLTLIEKAVQIFRHPKVWEWRNDLQ